MVFTIKRLFVYCVLLFCLSIFVIQAEETTSTSTSSISTTTKTKTKTTTTITNTPNATPSNNDQNQQQNNFQPPGPGGPPPGPGGPGGPGQFPIGLDGRPLEPPKDENGRVLPAPTGPDGHQLPMQIDSKGKIAHPKKKENGEIETPQLDEYGEWLYPQLDAQGYKLKEQPKENPFPQIKLDEMPQGPGPQGPNQANETNSNLLTYIMIFCGAVFVVLLLLLLYIFKYKRSINGKIKRLEQVKDMQSLEASNTRPLTTVSPAGFIEDKRDVVSSHSSARKTPLYTESLSLKSTTSDNSIYDDQINYLTEVDYNGQGYLTNTGYATNSGYATNATNIGYVSSNVGYVSPNQVLVNKSLGKYGYEGQYHGAHSSLGVTKNDLDGLYSKTLEPYDTDDAVVSPVTPITPVRPQSILYDTSGNLSSMVGGSVVGSAYANSINTPVMANAIPNANAMIPGNGSLSRTRNYNASVQSLNKIGYDADLSYGQMKYNSISPIQPMTPIQQISPIQSLSPVSPSQISMVAQYSQVRMDPRIKRRSHSIDITRSKRNSYLENIGKRSPGLYSPSNGSPMISRKSSIISESRSAKSVLIDQMVHQMDLEAESDDTLSNYPMDETASKASSIKAKIVNVPPKEPVLMKRNSISHQKPKITPVSSTSSIVNISQCQSLTDTSKTYINNSSNDELKDKSTEEETKNVLPLTPILKKKKIKKEVIGKNDLNRDFITSQQQNIFSQESDSCYESNNSFNQSIYDDEVKVFEVEDDDLNIN